MFLDLLIRVGAAEKNVIAKARLNGQYQEYRFLAKRLRIRLSAVIVLLAPERPTEDESQRDGPSIEAHLDLQSIDLFYHYALRIAESLEQCGAL